MHHIIYLMYRYIRIKYIERERVYIHTRYMICFWNRVCMKIIEYIVHCSHQDMLKTAAETGGLPPDRTCTLRWDQRWHTNKDDALLFPSLSMKSTISTELWLRLQCLNASASFRWFQTSPMFLLFKNCLHSYIRIAFISFFKLASRHPRIFSGWGWSFILATVIFSTKMRLKNWFPSVKSGRRMVTCIARICEKLTSYTIIVPSKPNQRVLGVRVTAATTATRFRPKHCVSVNLSESIEGWPQHEDSMNFSAKWLVWWFVIDSLIFGMIQVFPTVNHSMHFACHLQLQRSRLLSLTDHTSSMSLAGDKPPMPLMFGRNHFESREVSSNSVVGHGAPSFSKTSFNLCIMSWMNDINESFLSLWNESLNWFHLFQIQSSTLEMPSFLLPKTLVEKTDQKLCWSKIVKSSSSDHQNSQASSAILPNLRMAHRDLTSRDEKLNS